MKPLRSVAVFGLLPVPPAEATQSNYELRNPAEALEVARRMFSCRPSLKRLAIEEEIARIRDELKESGAIRSGRLRALVVQSVRGLVDWKND